MNRYYYIKTFGCQMNEHDSARMALMLEALGYSRTDDPMHADAVLFNTCTIRQKAHHKAISEAGRSREIRRLNPGVAIGICGCVAQEEGPALLARFPDVDFVFGPDQIAKLPDLLDRAKEGSRSHELDLVDDPGAYHFPDFTPPVTSHKSRVTAFVTAIKGCNCACSYCIVPSVRGREISRPADQIVKEAAALAEGGTKEVVLLGQNVCAYGRRDGAGLAALIRRVADETAISRIRFTSPHPRDVGDELIAEYAENEKLAPHIHLPAQAGSDEVLRRMRRGYTRERYIDIARRLRAARPGMSITTDLIVGFCGERRADFEQTLDLMREVDFDSAFAFKYSPRPGTEAAEKMDDDVPQQEKEARLSELLALQRAASRRRNEAMAGKREMALACGRDRMGKGLLSGRLPDNRIVHFPGQEALVGSIVPVLIRQALDNSLIGEVDL